MLGREVFPIFYDVDPSDIRYHKGSFGKAFKKHEKRYREDKVKKWRDALGEVAGLSGWHTKNRYHSEIIEKIVAELWTKLQGEVTHLLEICGLYPIIGINVLLEKCLLIEYCDNKKWYLGMHDMLQEMGKNVVIQESINDAGKRSRLWLQEDIDHVLIKNMGSQFIQGIVLESWTHKALWDPKVLESWSYKALRDPKVLESSSHKALWDPKAFSNMCNLKILIFITVDLPLGLDCLSEGLRYLEWRKFPLEELPLDNQLDELVELKMMLSKIKQPWHGIKFFRKLKLIDLSNSEELIRFPSVFGVPCLEQLILEGCINLEEVDQSVGQHKKLMLLNLTNCVNLKILPSKLEMDSLKDFILSGCSKVKKLPEFGDNMKNLSSLDLKDCRSLVCLPNSIHNAKSLRTLNIIGCSKLSRLPENLDGNEALEELNMSGTAIKEVPPSIILLKGLKKLSIGGHKEKESNCWSLSLPSQFMFWRFTVSSCIILPTMSRFSCLEELDLSYCNLSNESLPVGLGCLSSLRKLDLSGNNFVNLPANCIANLSKLYHLGLDCCPRLESVPVLPPHIGSLYGRNCASWKPFSDPLYLCDFFASHKQICSDTYTLGEEAPFLFIAGSDIPPWFTNQSYFHLSLPFHYEVFDPFQDTMQPMTLLPTLSNQLLMSITVDIPQYHLSSEWWGIAVCLVLENPFPYVPWSVTPIIYWICKSAEAELPNASAEIYIRKIEEFSEPHLLILLLRGNHRNIQRHLIRGDHSKLQLSFHAHSLLKISKCGGRVLCKEELEAWAKARDERRHFSSLNRSIVREIGNVNQCLDRFEGEYVNASNAEAKRRKLG
ncbi:hypothetical protein L6164_031622 [Bauhinia variegata]|uniref:Uncharacterized protein n=1 Tax=Bauhinia variegata TaxID=167791 RepID=A0ACB9LHM3_BAUVA|nr:hypothetical protein L6164_031622 [Bauhinia variegata]